MIPSQAGDATESLVPLLLGTSWHEDKPGGLARYHAQLFSALRSLGLEPQGIVLGPAHNAPAGIVVGGRSSQFLPLRLWAYSRAATRVASTGVTVVDAHFALYAVWPVVVGRLRRLPLVVHFQGPWADESLASGELFDWHISIKRRVETLVYRRARMVIVLSVAFKQLLVDRYGVAPWLVEVIPPGIDLDRFVPADQTDARARLGLPGDSQVVVAVRRLVPRMGVDILLKAWARLERTLPDARLLVVGDGPERERLRVLAYELGLSSVGFLGQVDEETLVRCYQAADLSVVPTVALEGFGLVVLESLACGTPVVATDAGGLAEALVPLDPSLIVPTFDDEALARRMQAALDGTNTLPDEDRCRAHAKSFGWPMVAERHRVVYSRAIRHGARRLRVVYLDHSARLSGGELALLRLLPSLDVDAHVILAEEGPLVGEFKRAGVSVEVMAMAGSAGSLGRERVQPGRLPASALVQSAAYVARIAIRLHQLEPDLVHTNSLKAALYGGVAARLASVPVVWHVRDRITDDYLPPSARRLVRIAASLLPDTVIANSETTLKTLGRASKHGVAIASPLGFTPSASAHPTRNLPLRVGMVGRLDRWKGQHVFLEAFAMAFPRGPEEAIIVGASLFGVDGYESELERQVTALALEGRVVFRGFCDKVEDELLRLDVLVHASIIPEPFGQVVVEGMAAGLPVVAADAGGPAEVIRHERDGLLYPSGNVEALCQALRRLAVDPTLRQNLGDAARLRAQDFTADRIAPQVMAVYRKTLQGKPGDDLAP